MALLARPPTRRVRSFGGGDSNEASRTSIIPLRHFNYQRGRHLLLPSSKVAACRRAGAHGIRKRKKKPAMLSVKACLARRSLQELAALYSVRCLVLDGLDVRRAGTGHELISGPTHGECQWSWNFKPAEAKAKKKKKKKKGIAEDLASITFSSRRKKGEPFRRNGRLPLIIYVASAYTIFFWLTVNHRDEPESWHKNVSLREAENLVNQRLVNAERPYLFHYGLHARTYAGQGRKWWLYRRGGNAQVVLWHRWIACSLKGSQTHVNGQISNNLELFSDASGLTHNRTPKRACQVEFLPHKPRR